MAEENALRSDSDSSPGSRRFVEVWLPQKPCFGAAVAMTGQEVRARLLLRMTSTTSITSLVKSLGKIGQVKWSLISQRIGSSDWWH